MPTPTATIFLPYHALDDVILRGTRAAQPAASAVVAGTLYGVTDEGNAVERSTGAVWQAYSPTGGGGGAPAAHHATHEPGGSDALAALSATTLTSGTLPDARLSANVPLLNAANVFTGNPQTVVGDLAISTPQGYTRLICNDQAPPANARIFDIVNISQQLQFRASSDALVEQARPLTLSRTGDALVAGNLYEKGRATPMGHWQTGDCSSYNSAGLSGPIRWSLMGKTMVLLFTADGVIGSGLASIALTIPGGYSSLLVFVGAGLMVSTPAKTWHTGVVATGGGFTLDLYDELLGVWPAGHVYINGSLTLAVP